MSEPAPARCAVRSASPADAPVLTQLAERLGLSSSTRRSLSADLARTELGDPRAPVVLVAVRADEVAGAALGVLQHDEGHVLDLAVDPARRRHGVGTTLLRALLDALLARGARAVTLEVRAGDLGAQALYRAEGFVVEGHRPGYYPDGEDAVIMWWRPDPAGAGDPGTVGADTDTGVLPHHVTVTRTGG